MQLSLELEYWTIDSTGALAPATPVLDRIDDLDAESADPLLEVVTDPCDGVAELEAEVTARLREAIDVAREEDRRLVPLSTPLNAGSISTSDGPRTEIQRRVLGERFADATRCAGTHLHIDQIAGAETDQLNLLTALDPAFALVASSGHHRGEAVANCARPHVYRRGCYGDHPELGRLRPYVDDTAEWDERVADSFERFRREAMAEGVDPAAFEEQFTPEDSTWTPVRLREEFGTIEWRAPDVALPGQILRLVTDVRNAVDSVVDRGLEIGGRPGVTGESVTVPEFDRLQEHTRAAIDDGLDAPAVSQYLERMGFDPADYRPIAKECEHVSRLSRERARRLRLRYADRLEWEVEALSDDVSKRAAVPRSKTQRRVPTVRSRTV
ncbi:glutamate-cysteine ligase family protein [Halalkalicoccus tibetensis]|uniref:Glutamate-cysteine ligase family protein n=1 Tax=Halalkalicoccus tibetensis TaxID=175632 RepID=A0ABD5V728_9EURY